MSASVAARGAELAAPLESLAGRAVGHAAAGRLVVLTGPSGCGRTRVLDRVARLQAGPVLAGGGLAGLRTVPALALSRALRMPVPTGDPVAAAEFVLAAAGRATLLLVDDLQLTDAVSLEVVALLAGQLPVVVAVADDTAVGVGLVSRLRALPFVAVEPVPPLATDDARAVVRATNPGLDPDAVHAAVAAAGGNPAALVALALDPQAADRRTAVAERLLTAGPEARTALSLLGLLGRPAGPDLLDASLVRAALAAGLVVVDGDVVTPRSTLDVDVTLQLLTAEHRRALHRFLAARVGDAGERARHHEAAGDHDAATRAAQEASARATTMRERVVHLAVAARSARGPLRVEACMDTALIAGDVADHRLAVALVDAAGADDDPRAALVRARAALAAGDVAPAMAQLDGATARLDGADTGDPIGTLVRIERARALCLVDPVEAMGIAAEAFGAAPATSLRARAAGVLGAAQLAAGVEGWEAALEAAQVDAGECGLDDVALAAAANRCSGYLQRGDADAAHALANAGRAIATRAGAAGWAGRFAAVGLWVTLQVRCALAEGRAAGSTLLDGALPAALRCEIAAHVALAHADGGDLTAALAGIAGLDPSRSELLAWCDAELAALGGDVRTGRSLATALLSRARLWPVPAFAAVTAGWSGAPRRPSDPAPVGGSTVELAALDDRSNDPGRAAALFDDAAERWVGYSGRSVLRCRVAAALATAEVDPDTALERLLRLATELEALGLTLLGVQVTRARRRLGDPTIAAAAADPRGGLLSRREREVLAAVGGGATSSAIAARLGVAPSTIETHVKSAMRKLGAATRTEAAVRAAQLAEP